MASQRTTPTRRTIVATATGIALTAAAAASALALNLGITNPTPDRSFSVRDAAASLQAQTPVTVTTIVTVDELVPNTSSSSSQVGESPIETAAATGVPATQPPADYRDRDDDRGHDDGGGEHGDELRDD